jgi:hypothetical protein
MPNHLVVLAIHIGISFLIALLGMNRKMGFWGYFFSSILLGPLVGILLVLVSDPRRSDKK